MFIIIIIVLDSASRKLKIGLLWLSLGFYYFFFFLIFLPKHVSIIQGGKYIIRKSLNIYLCGLAGWLALLYFFARVMWRGKVVWDPA